MTTKTYRWWLMPLVLAVFAGCHDGAPLIDNCSTIPPGAIPQPIGTFSQEFWDRQSKKAEADDFVIYNYEWLKGGSQPGPYGQGHLMHIARRLPTLPFPVVIQPSPDPKLNESRRMMVTTYLMEQGIENVAQRVVVGYGEAEGLYGDEATRIYYQSLLPRGFGGMGGFGGGFGGMGGFGGGMGGMGGFGGGGFGFR